RRLQSMLEDAAVEVRRASVFALRCFDDEAAEAILRAASASRDGAMRAAAARALVAGRESPSPPGAVCTADLVRQGARPPHFLSLEAALRALPEDRVYSEMEITRLISQACVDYSSARRYLVEEGVFWRGEGRYRLTETGGAVWRVEQFIKKNYLS